MQGKRRNATRGATTHQCDGASAQVPSSPYDGARHASGVVRLVDKAAQVLLDRIGGRFLRGRFLRGRSARGRPVGSLCGLANLWEH